MSKRKASEMLSKKMHTVQDILTECLDRAQVKILSVGSGDGSQQESIVRLGHVNILTTFYDSRDMLLRKYPHVSPTLEYLEKHSYSSPKYEINAEKLDTFDFGGKFDLIIFTFPHTGVPNNDQNNVPSNQKLLRLFLKSAISLLTASGEIQITLKNGEHYDRWNVKELVQDEGLKYEGHHNMDYTKFPGYVHRLTKGMHGNLKKVPDKNGASVHVFQTSSAGTNSARARVSVDSNTFLGKIITIVGWSGPQNWTDEEVWAEIVNVLSKATDDTSMDVLEIRRRLELQPPLPNTRQLNRILYGKNGRGALAKYPPKLEQVNKKPTWELPCLE